MNNKRVLISGAGVAGQALAYWLDKYGFDVTVVEKAGYLPSGGYRIDIRGKALQVLDRMRLRETVRRRGTRRKGSTLINGQGKRIVDIDPDLFGIREEEDIEIMRGDLAEILYARTRHQVEYVFDDIITNMLATEREVVVNFKNSENRIFDLVVGADGMNSQVRKKVFDSVQHTVQPLGYGIAVFSVPDNLVAEECELGYSSAGKLVTVYRAAEGGGCRALFIFQTPASLGGLRDAGEQKEWLLHQFKQEGSKIEELLSFLDESTDFYFSTFSQIHLDKLSQDRFVLVGDAGYCASPAAGQGASLALVGAYVLAGELAAAWGDYAGAFAKYEAQMLPFILQNQQLARTVLKEMIPRSGAKIWFQSAFLRLLPLLPNKEKLVQRMLRKIRRETSLAANAIQLKDYSRFSRSVKQLLFP